MTNKFAIYSGSTIDSVPPKFYWKNQNYKNLFGYAKTLEEADKIFNLSTIGDSKWGQLLCLTTFNIIKESLSFNIHKPLFEGYYSDEDCN
jgi:hypothetical protein